MFWTLLALFALVILGGFLSYYGDLQGRRWGKKRVSLFGLRPKHTAILITSLTGAFIALLSILTVLIAAPALREVVLRGEMAIRENRKLNADLIADRAAYENELRRVRAEYRANQDELKSAQERLVALNNDLSAKQVDIQKAQGKVIALTNKNTQLEQRQAQLEEKLRQEQRQLAQLDRQNQRLAILNRKKNDDNIRAEAINKGLGQQNVALARTNLELEQESQELQEENDKLAQTNAQLKQEGSDLARRNEILLKTNGDLLTDNAKNQRLADDLNTKVRELELEQDRLYTQLAGAGQTFAQSFTALRQGKLILRSGSELARRLIPAHTRPEAVKRELLALLGEASATAQKLGAAQGENGRAVAIVKKRVVSLTGVERTDEQDSLNALIEVLSGSDSDMVVLANAINNTVAGEQALIELTPRSARPILTKGQVIASRVINARQPVERIADDIVAFLQNDVRDAAIREGIIPQIDPETGTEQVGVAVARDLVSLTDQVRRVGRTVRLEARAADALTSADRLRLSFRVTRME
jgi:uncharacterized protein (DUF3084 family)